MDSPSLPARPLPSRWRRTALALGGVVVLVLLVLSHGFGRAEPTNNYRPLLPAAALSTGCFPLPGGASLDALAHQVRWDGDVETGAGPRRELRGQFDLVDADEALELITDAFLAVGFRPVPVEEDGSDGDGVLGRVLHRGAESVAVSVRPLPDTEEALVRGEFVLDLPVVAAAKDDPVCSDPKSTKRWGERELAR